jgi:ribose-phosphate pyrophosphokinase
MILFAASEFASLAAALRKAVPELGAGEFRTGRFDNGELFIQLDTPVSGERYAVLGSIAPPEGQLFSTLLLAHTLRKEGAKQVTGVFPYLAYSRQDKNKPGESLAAAWIGALAYASGLDRVLTIDVHGPDDQRLFPMPLISTPAGSIFGTALNRYQLAAATIIAPDEGAISRCEAVRAGAGLASSPIPWFEKHRAKTGIQHSSFHGETSLQAVLVDDILDTGATLISACERLLLAGVENIQIMVTHGLFTGTGWERLWGLGVSRIFCTDTIPRRAEINDARIVTLSIMPLLARAL